MSCSASSRGGLRGGYGLMELVLALAILALLAALALPGYRDQVLVSRRSLAAAHLQLLQLRQAQFFSEHRRYAADLRLLGHGAPACVDGAGRPIDAGHKRCVYRIELEPVEPGGYRLRAVPRGPQMRDRRCGVLGLDSSGVRSASGPGGPEECWH